jgi:hypothetical protein
MINRTTASGALRIHYRKNLSDILTKNPLMRSSTLVGLLAKRKGDVVKQSQGSAYAVPIKSKRTLSSNFTFAKAQANAQATAKAARFDTFLVPVVYGTGAGFVDGQANAILKGDQNGFVDAMQSETDDAIFGAQNEIALFSYRTGTGSRGRVSAVTATAITLVNRSDLVNFEVGMDLLAAAADGTGAVRSATVVPITNINWRTGVLSCTVDPTGLGWSAAAGGDYIFIDGDFSAGVSTKIQGLGAWCPIAEPTVGTEPTFMGVARYNEPRLCGVRHDMSTSDRPVPGLPGHLGHPVAVRLQAVLPLLRQPPRLGGLRRAVRGQAQHHGGEQGDRRRLLGDLGQHPRRPQAVPARPQLPPRPGLRHQRRAPVPRLRRRGPGQGRGRGRPGGHPPPDPRRLRGARALAGQHGLR